MRRAVLLLLCALGLVATSAYPLPAAGQEGFASTGGTQVSVEGSVVTVTVTIDLLVGGVGETELPEGAQETADSVAADIESYWNAGFARYGSDCVEVRLDAVITVLPTSMPPPVFVDLGDDRPVGVVTEPGHHVVLWAEGGNYGGNVPPPETYDPYDEDGVAPPGEDFGSPFEHELYATWSPHLEDSRDFAHEFGHLLGFGDDYDGDEALPGREGTLMDHGDLIDEALVNRLIDLIQEAGTELPECWTGTAPRMRSEVIYSGGPYRCEDAWRFDFTFTEAEDGTVDGEGTAELVQDWICEPTFPGAQSPSQEFDYSIEGERSGEAFDLKLTHQGSGTVGVGMAAMWNPESRQASVTIPVADGRGSADASWTWSFTNPDGSLVKYFTDGTIEIACPDCPG